MPLHCSNAILQLFVSKPIFIIWVILKSILPRVDDDDEEAPVLLPDLPDDDEVDAEEEDEEEEEEGQASGFCRLAPGLWRLPAGPVDFLVGMPLCIGDGCHGSRRVCRGGGMCRLTMTPLPKHIKDMPT